MKSSREQKLIYQLLNLLTIDSKYLRAMIQNQGDLYPEVLLLLLE